MLTVFLINACDEHKDTVKTGRDAVKEPVTQPFSTLESTRDALKQSENKQMEALEEANKQIK